jgi:hypothetical protein
MAESSSSSKPEDDGNDNDNDNNNNSISIEQVFGLLKDGKGFQSNSDYWNAADRFVQAQDMLQSLAEENSQGTEEEQEIATLYEQQAREYLFQSRQCLIEAMSQERAVDEDSPPDQSLKCRSLSEKEAEMRTRTFAMLFSKFEKKILNAEAEDEDENINIDEQQCSLEERLQELNASLPSDLKSSDERMNDINKGLNRLGLSLYPQKEPFARFMKEEEPTKDEDEQIADVIAQAQDEVAVAQQFGEVSKHLGKKSDGDDDDDFTESDDDDEEDEQGDELLEDEQLAMKAIRRKVVKAQTKLAQLVAYLDEVKTTKDKEDADEDLNDDDNDSIEKPDYTTYLVSGKKKLRGARRDLKKALEEWAESLS